jgi:hypothetical protein
MKNRCVPFEFALVGLVLVVALVGCQSKSNSGPPAHSTHHSYAPEDLWQTLEHDGGEVLAGDEVAHAFTLKNELSSIIQIVKDGDIVANCGCASVFPAARELAPGDATPVTVKIATTGKSGPFKHGGHIAWTDAEGKVHVAVFSVRGVARPPLRVEPHELVFERADLAKGLWKELQLTLDPAVDRESLSLVGPEQGFVIEKKDVAGAQGAVYSIKCLLLPSGEEEEWYECVFTAKLAKEHGGSVVSAKAFLLVQRVGNIDVQPSRLVVRFGPDGRGVAKCVVSGDAWQGPEAIETITCPGYRLEWKPTRLGSASTATIIQLTLFQPDDRNSPKESLIQIKAKGLDMFHVPVEIQE